MLAHLPRLTGGRSAEGRKTGAQKARIQRSPALLARSERSTLRRMSGYGNLCSDFYDIDKPEAPPDALEYYLREAERARGPILEPMCGTGRFLLPLLERGLDVEGVDASSSMLARCEARALRRGLTPKLHEQRLEELVTARRFRLIFIPSGSFSLLTDVAQVQRALERVHAALLPGGRFLVEIERRDPSKPSELSGTWGGRWVTRPDGAKIIFSWLSSYTAPSGIVSAVHRYELVKDGRLLAAEYEDFELKLYELSELRQLMQAAGFTQIQMHTPYTLEPVAADGAGAHGEEDGVIVSARRSE